MNFGVNRRGNQAIKRTAHGAQLGIRFESDEAKIVLSQGLGFRQMARCLGLLIELDWFAGRGRGDTRGRYF
jgi:hypothetical protein